MRWQLQQPGLRQVWHVWGEKFRREYREFVDGVIREVEAAS
jgi:hypothetical protein